MAEQAKLTFTQIPNQILDTMTHRTPNENLVLFAICRKTYGWAKTKDKISLSQIQEMTGLSRQGTVNNIRSLKTNGWIESDKIVKPDNTVETIYMPLLKNKEELSRPRIEPEKWSNKTGRNKATNSGRKRSQTVGLAGQSNGLTGGSQMVGLETGKTQSNGLTGGSQTVGHTKDSLNKKESNISLNKGQTETGSESSNPDKQTKITLTKEQDTPEKRKISHAEMIQGDDLYKDGQESLEMARIGLNSIIPFSKIANEISTKRFRKTLIEDHPSQIQLGKVLEGNTDDFRKLCEYMLADDFYKKLGFTYKNLLSCYAHRNDVLTAEPVKKTAYNTRDYNSPEHKAEIAKIVQAAENRQKGIVPEQAPRKTLAQAVKERMAREKLAKEMEELKHAV